MRLLFIAVAALITALPAAALDISFPEFVVQFPAGDAEILPTHHPVIDEAALRAKEWKATRMVVVGCADDSGRDEAHRLLGERRARAVADSLVNAGVDPRIMSVYGIGQSEYRACEDRSVLIAMA